MKEIFNIKRFGNYFAYDLKNAWQRFGLSAILTGLLPILLFIFRMILQSIVSTVVEGDPYATMALNTSFASMAFACWAIIITFVFPEKTYGHLTSKKAGSNFLLLPASSFEKTLSMILIAGIIVPALSGAIFFGSDRLLSLISSNGDGMLANLAALTNFNFKPFIGVCILSFFCNMMIFTLGAIFFKKAKAAKTLLISLVISTIAYKIFGSLDTDTVAQIAIAGSNHDIPVFTDAFVRMSYITNGTLAALLMVGIFFRIKTLKH